MCDLETSSIGAPYIYNVRLLRVKKLHTEVLNCKSVFRESVAGGPIYQPILCTEFYINNRLILTERQSNPITGLDSP